MKGARSGPRSGKPRPPVARATAIGILLAGLAMACVPGAGAPEVSRTVNRTLSAHVDPAGSFVRLDSGEGDGLAVLEGWTFSTGELELRVRGEDVEGRSFVGLAFNVQNDSTYEAVYLRPFNFRTEDPARRLRAVQYMAQPEYPWNRLREASPGRYEAPARTAPDPDDWVRLRLVVTETRVQVHVDGSEVPDLVVERLSPSGEGGVAFWVGNGSGGDFALGERGVFGGRHSNPASDRTLRVEPPEPVPVG